MRVCGLKPLTLYTDAFLMSFLSQDGRFLSKSVADYFLRVFSSCVDLHFRGNSNIWFSHCGQRAGRVFSRVLRDSAPRFVSPSVGRLVGFSAILSFLGSQLFLKCHYKSF